MSTYTPYFPPSDPKPRRTPGRGLSSTSSSSSISGLSFGARLSRAHLALASVSDYIERPPSPTSAAVDPSHVVHLHRKFRLAVAAAYRDTSSGKWAHVSELARLGCTIGRWQGVCSGSKAPHSLYPPGAGDRNDQGVVDDPLPEVNPYPRPPVPIFDLGEIRERVENWQANVVSAPLSQADSQGPNLLHSAEDAELLSPLHFPTVKRRKSDVAKAMKRKRKASPDRDYTTSRYFRGDGHADRMSQAQAVNRDAGCVTPAPRPVPRGSNAELTPQSRPESPDEDPETACRPSPASPASPIRTPVPESIHQIAEAFLPPSFPSQLQTSTPPACDRLIKPPVIPRAEGLFLSPSLPSPPPFPHSQPDYGSSSQPHRTPAPHTRSQQDIPSPAGSPSPMFKRRLQATVTMAAPEKPTPAPSQPPSSRSDSESPHGHGGDVRMRRDRDLDLDDHLPPAPAPVPAPNPPAKQASVIDLRQLAMTSSQRSRDSLSRHPTRAFGSSPMTPRTAGRLKDNGKSRAMTVDLASPYGTAKRSRALSSPQLLAPPGPLHSSPRAPPPSLPLPLPHVQTQTPPLSPLPDFTRDAHAFAPVATSTQQQQQPPHAPSHGSRHEISDLEADEVSRGSGVFGRERDVDVDAAAWVRDVPVVEADGDVDADVGADVGVGVCVGKGEEKGAGDREGEKGLPYSGLGSGLGRVSQALAEMVPADEHV